MARKNETGGYYRDFTLDLRSEAGYITWFEMAEFRVPTPKNGGAPWDLSDLFDNNLEHDVGYGLDGNHIQELMAYLLDLSESRAVYVYMDNFNFNSRFFFDFSLRYGLEIVWTTDKKGGATTKFGDEAISLSVKGKDCQINFISAEKRIGKINYDSLKKMFKLPENVSNSESLAYMMSTLYQVGQRQIAGFSAFSYNELQKSIGHKKFKRDYPVTFWEPHLQAVKGGGLNYINPIYLGEEVFDVTQCDVSHFYPSITCMQNGEFPLPWGKPIPEATGYEFVPRILFPIAIQNILFKGRLKEGRIGAIDYQKELSGLFKIKVKLVDTDDEWVPLQLWSFQIDYLKSNYDGEIIFEEYWKFQAYEAPLIKYMDKYISIKKRAEQEGNLLIRELAKLMMVAVIGKFGQNPEMTQILPKFDNTFDKVDYTEQDKIQIGYKYSALNSAVVSYGRIVMAEIANNFPEDVVAIRTDAIDIKGYDPKKHILKKDFIWKFETNKYNRYLAYNWHIHSNDKIKLDVKAGGLSEYGRNQLTFDTFISGTKVEDKVLLPVKGGAIYDYKMMSVGGDSFRPFMKIDYHADHLVKLRAEVEEFLGSLETDECPIETEINRLKWAYKRNPSIDYLIQIDKLKQEKKAIQAPIDK